MEPTRREFIAGLALAGVVPATAKVVTEEPSHATLEDLLHQQPKIYFINPKNLPRVKFESRGSANASLSNFDELWDQATIADIASWKEGTLHVWVDFCHRIHAYESCYYGECVIELRKNFSMVYNILVLKTWRIYHTINSRYYEPQYLHVESSGLCCLTEEDQKNNVTTLQIQPHV